MAKLIRYILLSFLGFFLAFLVSYGPALVDYSLASFRINRVQNAEIPQPEKFKEETIKIGYEKQKRELAADSLTVDRKLALIGAALEEGTQDSLSLLRPNLLKQIPDYDTIVSPAVKNEALNNLLMRFVESDWADWPRSAHSLEGGPSSARLYVDDITSVNPDLGAYLETAAELFYGMYISLMQGKSYDVNQELEYLEIASGREFEQKGQKQKTSYKHYLKDIINDENFLDEFEKWRAKLTLSYVASHPANLREQIGLIFDLRPSKVDEPLTRILYSILGQMSLVGTPEQRRFVLKMEEKKGLLQRIADRNSNARSTIAQFYAVSAIDALEKRELKKAEAYLSNSMLLSPRMKTNSAIARRIQSFKEQDTRDRSDGEDQLDDRDSVELKHSNLNKSKETSSVDIFSGDNGSLSKKNISQSQGSESFFSNVFANIVILIVLSFIGFRAYLFFRRRKFLPGQEQEGDLSDHFSAQSYESDSANSQDQQDSYRPEERGNVLRHEIDEDGGAYDFVDDLNVVEQGKRK